MPYEVKCIVYQHIRLDTNTIFYIGIGKNLKRPYSKNYRNNYWHNVVNKAGYKVEILFENQTWIIDILNNKIIDSENNLLFIDEKFEIINTYIEQMTYFIDAVKNKKQTMNSFANSIDILKLCLNDGNVK